MDKDIVPTLLELIEKEFDERTFNSEVLKKAIQALNDKTATYKNANDFAIEVGEILVEVLGKNITAEVLPDGKMYFNIADRIINSTMGKNHELISGYAADVQTELNHNAGLKMKGQKAELNQSRVDGIINRISSEDDFNAIKWILNEPIINFSQSIIDETIRTNAEFHSKAGLQPKIIRRSTGKCCDWCNEIVGTYNYPDVPKDVYRRHRYCRCTVDYYPGDGKKQNIWTKEWIDPKKDAKIEARKKIGLDDIKKNNRADDTKQFKAYMEILGAENMPVSVAQFQELKYNTPEKWEKLQDNYYIKSRLKDGSYGSKINTEKQLPHMKSTRIDGKSYFEDDVNTQELFNKYAGTGKMERDSKGKRKNIEVIYLDYDVGIEGSTGNKVNGIKIHHSKNRMHIVPVRRKG
ncbi:polymorphic toxin type 50 domain-containing protein [Paratissierella segnis]|jgi:hypothetical protein|uniref:Bacterial toxin 50 domain-containing protein n=1 Tax=Paratissierella segnis TaxID=2763679 RepID=A0A926EVL7_9FIRM|nr:polymorphic toxin type 50 domain-containing protein [Paratissierella segnis]MBC8589340.1 hypothetical protein [Paratissierella segnis]